MELKTVLLIEDKTGVQDSVKEEFALQGITVLTASDPDTLEQHLNQPVQFDMIILDWLLDGDSSILSQLCLQKIRQSCFVPVIVWTEELEAFETEKDDVAKIFPVVSLRGFSKGEVNHTSLLNVLTDWYETVPAKLGRQLRQSMISSVEKALYTLAEQSSDDLTKGLKTLISLGGTSEVDMEHSVDVLMRLVSRMVYEDSLFMEQLKGIVGTMQLSNPNATKEERLIESRIKNLHMYYTPTDNIVRTGDIVEVKVGEDVIYYGIVITPACDLAQLNKTAFLRIALIVEKIGQPKEDKWPRPQGLSGLIDQTKKYEVSFHEVVVLKNITFAALAKNNNRSVMLYTHQYQFLEQSTVSLKRLKRLDEPYRSDLLHHFISHAGRIGLPEFTAP